MRRRVQADVDDGIRLFECREIGHGRRPPRPLRRTDADVFAGREDVHQVTAGAEERGQLRQHESRAPGQHEPQAAALAQSLWRARSVAIRRCLNANMRSISRRARTSGQAASAERQREVDVVDERRAALASRLHT